MKIICIGRNYVAHARELGNEVPAEPVFFLKPDTSLLPLNKPFTMPEWTRDVHHEIELVLKISRNGKNIPKDSALHHIGGIGLGIDFTARDVQNQLKAAGLPWEKAKAFDQAAALGSIFFSPDDFPGLRTIPFSLTRNGATVQSGNSGLMIYGFDDILHHVSKYITLKKGDLVYTGTPAGVGPVSRGDHLEGFIGNQKVLELHIK